MILETDRYDEPAGYVSTGSLPDPSEVRGMIDAAYERYLRRDDGVVASYIPALATVNPDLLVWLWWRRAATHIRWATPITRHDREHRQAFVFALVLDAGARMRLVAGWGSTARACHSTGDGDRTSARTSDEPDGEPWRYLHNQRRSR